METRRILLDGVATTVERDGEELVAPDGRRVPLGERARTSRPPSPPRSSACT